MKDKTQKAIDLEIIDAIMERPHTFRISDVTYYFYPMTLGKTFLLQRFIKDIGMNIEYVKVSMNMEFLRVVKANRERCCELVAYMTARNEYYDVFDADALEERKKVFLSLPDEDIATFLVVIMNADKTDIYIRHIGIDKEQKRMKRVLDVKNKNDKNTFSFGGLSLYGSLIDAAMERYKMTKRQVVWELDYTSLRILMADRVSTLYVTDDERKKIRIPKDRRKISGDNKKDILNFIKSQDWD